MRANAPPCGHSIGGKRIFLSAPGFALPEIARSCRQIDILSTAEHSLSIRRSGSVDPAGVAVDHLPDATAEIA
jgi:hypothetical protein